MSCRAQGLDMRHHLVGHPIDVVTGANTDVAVDFTLVAALPLRWSRYYNSAHHQQPRSLGWGHAHEYDRWLRHDLDGLRYTGPDGVDVGFPPLEQDGSRASAGGFTLYRVEPKLFRLARYAEPIAEFRFSDPESPAHLTSLVQDSYNIVFIYGVNGRLKKIRDSASRLLRLEHDPQGRLLAVVRTQKERGRTRSLITYAYDEAGNLIRGTDAYGHSFSFSWDAERRMTSSTDRRGYTFFFEYDSLGRCVHSRGEDGLLEVLLSYRPREKQTVVTRADGGEWSYRYNDAGIVTQIMDPYGGETVFMVGKDGRVSEEVGPDGTVKRYVYDSAGVQLGIRNALGRFSKLEEPETDSEDPEEPMAREYRDIEVPSCAAECDYGDLLDLDLVSLPRGDSRVLRQLPSWAKNLVQLAPEDDLDESVQDSNRRGLIEEKGPGGVRTIQDEFGTLIREVSPDGSSCRWVNDANGNPRLYKDCDGSEYTYRWKSWNLLAEETTPLGHAVRYEYLPTEKLASVVDAGSTRTDFSYDLKDRVTEIRREGITTEQYEYDAADNLLAKLDANGDVVLRREFGTANLTTVEQLASGERHSFEYDERGRVVRATGTNCEIECAYDETDTRILDLRDGMGVEHKVDAGFALRSTVFRRFRITYTEEDDGSLAIRDPTGASHTIRVTEDGLAFRTMPNGSSEISQYDGGGRCLLRAANLRSPVGPRTVQYEYSPEGDLRAVRDNKLGMTEYEYDADHRLSGMRLPGREIQRIAYDPADNLLRKPGLKRARIVGGNRLVATDLDDLEYDDHGRVSVHRTARGEYRYEYNPKGWLVRTETPKGEWRSEYDPFGRRTRKSFGGTQREYFWDNDRIAAEIDQTGRARIYLYTDLFAISPIAFFDYRSLEAEPESGAPYFVFCNQVSAPTIVTDNAGEAVWSTQYDPYGAAEPISGQPFHMPLRLPGQYFDEEISLHYNRFRAYSAQLGRYLQPDPIGLEGGLNLYRYTHNPLVAVDVAGLGGYCDPAARQRRVQRRNRQRVGRIRRRGRQAIRRGERAAPERGYTGDGKHGANWTGGPELARETGIPQGQWSAADLDFASEVASGLRPRESMWVDLPSGSTSVVHTPGGRTVPANRMWIRNNGTGTFHGYPAP